MQGETLIQGLLDPAAYQHATGELRLLETHSAWVVLTGEFAYKVKKPVNFGFLDFSTLEKRRHYCEEEIRLNRRLAPGLYLDVVSINGSARQPRVAADGPVLEYAVRMRQFPAGGLLSDLAEQKMLAAAHIDALVTVVGGFHRDAAQAGADSEYGEPADAHHWVRENFEHILPALETAQERERLEGIRRWSESEYARIAPLMRARRAEGFIRECHGDLHLGNITLIDGQVTPFDCIEFNAHLRWIDVLSEVAFLVMDLDDRGYPGFAWRFLNGYLQFCGDYPGLGVLRYYLVYRALVRAKVAMLRLKQAPRDSAARQEAVRDYRQYTGLAERYLAPPAPLLVITFGLSGSGKSTLARQLCERAGMLQIRSDIERKRMAGLAALDNSRSAANAGLYTAARTGETYARLAGLAGDALAEGYRVIVDATFLKQAQRESFRQLAASLQVPFAILHCRADDAELERRIVARAAAGNDPSEAGLEVLHAQQRNCQPLSGEELRQCIDAPADSLDLEALHNTIDTLAAAGAS